MLGQQGQQERQVGRQARWAAEMARRQEGKQGCTQGGGVLARTTKKGTRKGGKVAGASKEKVHK